MSDDADADAEPALVLEAERSLLYEGVGGSSLEAVVADADDVELSREESDFATQMPLRLS